MPLDPVEIVGGLAIGEGLGGAIADTVEPRLQNFKNDQWSKHQDKPLEPADAAEVAAEDVDSLPRMITEASFSGLDETRFRDLYGATLNAPGTGQLIELLRRNAEVGIDFEHGLRKTRLETQWDDALRNLASARLSPQEIALGIVRSTVADPGLLAVDLDVSGGIVPAYPVWPGNALAEAATGGFDADRLRVLVGAIGLPMSAQQAASAYFRDIIRLPDFNRAILEGDTRPEWAPYILEQARQILTASQYAELQLRGFLTATQRSANTAKHGMSQADSDLLYDLLGRAPAVHAITTGLARGGTFNGTVADIPEVYLSSMQRGNLRPEYYNLSYANRYSYPSGFQIKSEAATDGYDFVNQTLLEIGWSPRLADHYAAKWTGGGATTAKADPHVAKAQTQLWNTTHTAYKNGRADATAATTALEAAGVSAAAAPAVLAIWDAERALIRSGPSKSDIRKQWRDTTLTTEQATDELMALGWSNAQAVAYLNE